MKTNHRVLLMVAAIGIVLLTAAVNRHGSIYAVGDRVNMAPGDDLFAGLRWRNIGPFHGGGVFAGGGGPWGAGGVFFRGAPRGGLEKKKNRGWVVLVFCYFFQIGRLRGRPGGPSA